MIAALARRLTFFCVLLSPAIALADTPKVVIVSVKGKKPAPNLTPQVKPMLERAFAGKATVVPFKKYQATAKKLKIKPKDMNTVAAAANIGRELQVTHVLIVESQSEKVGAGKKKKVINSAKVSLVETASGDVVLGSIYSLKGKKLTKDVGVQIVGDSVAKMTVAAPVPEPAAEAAPPPAPDAPPAPEPVADAPPPPPEPAADATAIAPAEAEATTNVASTQAMPDEAATQPVEVAAVTPVDAAPPAVVAEAMESDIKSPGWRPGLILRLGALEFLRRGRVEDDTRVDPVTYGGQPLPAGLLQLELYPLAFGGRGSWSEGIGIGGEVVVTQARTIVNEDTEEEATNNVLTGKGGLALRFVLGRSVTSPELKLLLGYTYSQFPLPTGVFPGLRYKGPYAGGSFYLPFVESFGVLVGGGYAPSLTVEGRAERLGELDSASSYVAEGGFRLQFSAFELSFMARMTQFSATYTGPSALTDIRSFTDASLSDRFLSGYVAAGMGF
jgi:hypothetical protein